MSKFFEKFKEKKNSELEEILENEKSYTELAREAAFKILKERDATNPSVLMIEDQRKKKIEQELIVLKRKREVDKKGTIFEELDLKDLYSKKAIFFFSVFFSPMYGAFLLGYNFKLIGKQNKAYALVILSIVFVFFFGGFSGFFIDNDVLDAVIGVLFNVVGGVVLSRFFWNKYLGKDVNYIAKNITYPLLLSVLIVMVYYLVITFGNQIIYGM